MRIKGYQYVPEAEAFPTQLLGDGRLMALRLSGETSQALGHPDDQDVILCLSTGESGWFELICLTDVPATCRDPEHLVSRHGGEVEAMLNTFKQRRMA